MKKFLLIIAVSLLPLIVNAASVAVVIDGVAYFYDDAWIYSSNKDVKVVPLSDGVKYCGDIVIKDSIECLIRDERWEYVTRKLPVTVISGNAFRDCPDLKSVTIPKTITSILEYAFLGTCTDINIYDIGAWAKISLGGWTKKTGQRDKYLPAFPQGFNLYLDGNEAKDLVIPASVKTVGEYQFYKCQNIVSVDVNATKVLSYAFFQCPNLVTVNVGGNVETIGSRAFAATMIESIVLPSSLTKIGDYAFTHCEKLKSVTFPENVQNISSGAFSGCSNLQTIYCYAKSPPTFYSDTFGESALRKLTVYVPRESVELYKSFVQPTCYYSWKDCAQILPMEEDPTGIAPISYNPSIEQQNGVIIIKNALDGVPVKAFSPTGILVASSVVSNGVAILNIQKKDAIVLLKIDDKTSKIRMK